MSDASVRLSPTEVHFQTDCQTPLEYDIMTRLWHCDTCEEDDTNE